MIRPDGGRYRITQEFGANPEYYKQFGLKGHPGIDYGMPLKTPVIAAEDGVATIHFDSQLGNYVMVMGAHKTLYCHLTKATISNGQQVKAGQEVGLSGNTGNSTGPHLHFGVKPIPQDNNNGYGGAIDPEPLFKEEVIEMITVKGVDVLYLHLYGKSPDQTAYDAHVGKHTFDETYELLKQQKAYQTRIDNAKAGKLDAVNHLPAELQKAYVAPEADFVPAGDLYIKREKKG